MLYLLITDKKMEREYNGFSGLKTDLKYFVLIF